MSATILLNLSLTEKKKDPLFICTQEIQLKFEQKVLLLYKVGVITI